MADSYAEAQQSADMWAGRQTEMAFEAAALIGRLDLEVRKAVLKHWSSADLPGSRGKILTAIEGYRQRLIEAMTFRFKMPADFVD